MAGTVIITKYSLATGSPATNDLAVGEQAYSFSSDKMFIGETSGSDVVARVVGGQLFTDMMDHTAGTLTASSAVIVDASSKINNFNIGNITVTGATNTISSTNTNGNIVITPHGSGEVIIDGLIHPQADGTAGQFLKTDGSGNLDFATVVSSFTIAAESGSNDTVNTGETLTFSAGEGINTTVGNNEITIAGELATDSNKGVASFSAAHFLVSTGVVTVAADGIDNTLIDWGTGSGQISTADIPEETNLYYTDERVDDRLSALIVDGEGITSTYNDGAGTFTIDGEDATTTNKGIASFATADFAVASGAVTIKALGVSNAQLVNDGITIGSDDTSLGGTITDLNGITSLDVDNLTLDANAITSTNANGDIELTPNGTGTVKVPSGYEGRAGFTADSVVNKTYVDAVANGLDVKKSVRVATTANLATAYHNGNGTLTASSNGAISIDGVTLVADNRVLVKDQSTAAQNGFYKVTTVGAGGAPYVLTRTPDADAANELTAGAFTFVEEGTANSDNGYVLATDGAVTLGTTAITFEQFSGAGQITAGAGLTKSGNTIDAVGTAGKITISADAITIATDYVGQNTITTLGTIGTGTWAATDVAVAHGGTGSSTAAGAATNLGLGTGDSPHFTAINVGHASDSTLARSSAGVLSIEGNIIYHATGTDIPVTDGGTGVSSHTGKSYWVSNAGGTAISYITGTQYQHLGFTSGGVPQASGTIDGGTF